MRERAQEQDLGRRQQDLEGLELAEVERDDASYKEGALPAVRAGDEAEVGGDERSASERAYDDDDQVASAEDDKDTAELKRKVAALVERDHDKDYRAAFDAYDKDHDGGIDEDELVELLKDARVGNRVTRGRWAREIIKRLDGGERDRKVQWQEFEAVFQAGDKEEMLT